MKDEIKSVLSQLSDRLTSPIFGSFVISWLLWNHRYIFILLTDLPINARFSLIERTLYPDWQQLLGRGFIAPALMSLVYITWYQDLSRWILARWDRRQTMLNEARNEAQKKRRLTEQETLEHWRMIGEKEESWRRRIAESEQSSLSSKAQAEKLQKENEVAIAAKTVAETEIVKLESRIAELKHENEVFGAELFDTEHKMKELIATDSRTSEALKNAQSAIFGLNERISRLQSEIDTLQSEAEKSEKERHSMELSLLAAGVVTAGYAKDKRDHLLSKFSKKERSIVVELIRQLGEKYPEPIMYDAFVEHLGEDMHNEIAKERLLEKLVSFPLLVTGGGMIALTKDGRDYYYEVMLHWDQLDETNVEQPDSAINKSDPSAPPPPPPQPPQRR